MKKVISILTLAIVIVSCSKSKDDAASPSPASQTSIAGFWKGTYDVSGSYAFLFRPDGTLRVYSNNADTALAKKGEGVYQLTADKKGIDGTYTYFSTGTHYSISAGITNEMKEMKGQYKQLDGNAAGTFTINKQ